MACYESDRKWNARMIAIARRTLQDGFDDGIVQLRGRCRGHAVEVSDPGRPGPPMMMTGFSPR